MLPESAGWPTHELDARAETLRQALERAQCLEGLKARVSSLPALVPYIVMGDWAWPKPLMQSHWLYQAARRRKDTRAVLRCHGPVLVPGSVDDDPVTIIVQGLPLFSHPVWVRGRQPTVNTLWRLANQIRRILRCLIEDWERSTISHEIVLTIERGYRQQLISDVIQQSYRPPALSFPLMERIRNHDFRAYCFWLVRQLLAEGHLARLTRCDADSNHVFLKTRQDFPGRRNRFCSKSCRKAWHNNRR
jgi:hypothetical protein